MADISRFWLDTEFYEDGSTIDLISIGVVAESGREFYAESSNFNWLRVPEEHWIQENVRPRLYSQTQDNDFLRQGNAWKRDGGVGGLMSRDEIRGTLLSFVEEERGETTPQFWAYYAAYDWVAVAQLFGRMIDLPKGWPMYCMDIKQRAVMLGDPDLPRQEGGNHNALEDARHNKVMSDFLDEVEANRG